MYNNVNPLIYRLTDIPLPVIYLAWLGEKSDEDNPSELAPPDIAGRRFARSVAGRTDHNFILERRLVGVGAEGADALGFVRVLHSIPWAGHTGGGRYSHALPAQCPPNLGWVLAAMTGRLK
jgi:hypothetical protein